MDNKDSIYDEKSRITFNYQSTDRNVLVAQQFNFGASWRDIIPVFKDFLQGVGYVFPNNCEFVLMPIEE